MIIGLDFDGTCCKHLHPGIGEEIPGCVDILRELQAAGHELILWTCRDGYGRVLAEQWFLNNDLTLSASNSSSPNTPYPSMTSRKIYCHLFIDDRGLGIPLTQSTIGEREYVDWHACRTLLQLKGYL